MMPTPRPAPAQSKRMILTSRVRVQPPRGNICIFQKNRPRPYTRIGACPISSKAMPAGRPLMQSRSIRERGPVTCRKGLLLQLWYTLGGQMFPGARSTKATRSRRTPDRLRLYAQTAWQCGTDRSFSGAACVSGEAMEKRRRAAKRATATVCKIGRRQHDLMSSRRRQPGI